MTLTRRLHLGCGEDYRDAWVNVDVNADVRTDEQFDLELGEWPLPDSHFHEIRAEHVFEHLDDVAGALQECRRVLVPGGRLTVVVPVGVNARTDPDHKHEWQWETPECYCGARHWDADVGLSVVDRDVRLRSTLPGVIGAAHDATIRARQARYGPGVWCFGEPHTTGEFEVVFER